MFKQLDQIGQRMKITVVTKGNAGEWFTRATHSSHWLTPEAYDKQAVVSTVTGEVLPGLFTSIPRVQAAPSVVDGNVFRLLSREIKEH